VTLIGLVLMVVLHGFITSNVPMGVPLEWNVNMVYGGLFLFWKHADVSVFDVSLPVAAVVIVMGIAFPLLRKPFSVTDSVSFGHALLRRQLGLQRVAFPRRQPQEVGAPHQNLGWIYDQLGLSTTRSTCVGIVGKVMAFRLMHLHGRLLSRLVPKAVSRLDEYEWIDGEMVAGMVPRLELRRTVTCTAKSSCAPFSRMLVRRGRASLHHGRIATLVDPRFTTASTTRTPACSRRALRTWTSCAACNRVGGLVRPLLVSVLVEQASSWRMPPRGERHARVRRAIVEVDVSPSAPSV